MPKRNWKDLTKREKFLVTMQGINNTLIEDQRLTKKEILNLYDSEIAPYGYPSHQEFLLYQALLTQAFNENILNGRYKGYKNAPTMGDSFSKNIITSYYITDAFANSLFRTDTPDSYDFIKQAMSLDVLPVINIIFSNDFDLGEDVCANIRRISISKREEELNIQVYSGKKASPVGYEFRIPFVKHDCCQLCATQENFSKNNIGDRIFYKTLAMAVHKNTITEERNKLAEDCVIAFQNETIPKVYKFVINLLCLLTQQPDIISVQKSSTKYASANNKGFGNHKVNNVPNVHWLGADFTTKVQYSRGLDTSLSEVSRGKPKKSHWRRGHWHTILQGPGRLQKKLRWFQPVFIKGNKETVLMEGN